MSARKVIVTGGNGNLGGLAIQSLLNEGYEVLNLDRSRSTSKICRTEIIDLCDATSLPQYFDGADAVIHLAGFQAPYEAPHPEVFSNNISATYNVMEAAVRTGLRRFVNVSSIAVYGFLYSPKFWQPEYLPLNEEYPCAPKDPYALAKKFSEEIADSFASTADVSFVTLRITGINFDLGYSLLPNRWKDPGKKIGTFWSYIDGRDAARALVLALSAKIDGHEIFNVANAESRYPQKTKDLVAKFLPKTVVRNSVGDYWGGLDITKASERMKFNPQYHWRNFIDENGNRV